MKRHNISGRDVTYTITDLDGTRTFTVLNNAVGIWTTFGVRGNSNTPVTVKVEGTLAQPRISTLAFDTDIDYDPTSDPTNRPTFKPQRYLTMAYSGGNLTEIKDGLGNTTAMEYYTDARKGLLKKITDAHSKVTEFDYADTHRNLTKIKDALLAETLFGYDNNGNLTSVQNPLTHSTAMAYDDENRLTRVQGPGGVDVSYQYDSLGRMLTRVSGGVTTRFTWDGWNCVKEDDGTNVFRWYCPEGELHSFERNSTFYQVHSDALGSVRAITDSSGAVVGSYSYGAWGETTSATHPSGFTMPVRDRTK